MTTRAGWAPRKPGSWGISRYKWFEHANSKSHMHAGQFLEHFAKVGKRQMVLTADTVCWKRMKCESFKDTRSTSIAAG